MSIYRVEKNSNYVVMNRTALNDKRLSWKAKGIIAYMLSMPDDWTFYINELIQHSIDGEASFRSGLKELKDHGYVKRFPVLNKEKRITHWETVIHEVPINEPLPEIPHVENPQVENPHVENQALLSIDKPSIENKLNINNNNSVYSEEFEQFWTIYPRKINKKKAFKSFKTAIKNHSLETILSGTEKYTQYCKGKNKDYIQHPTTFLNNDSFIDGYEEGGKANGAYQHRQYSDSEEYDLPF